ncbi:hypothetical protein C8R44DRAFT_740107 [Mycena epipterygia]|nr:hypothetical protein C8R44DRAFT_740107 [Mycena epipterygia]
MRLVNWMMALDITFEGRFVSAVDQRLGRRGVEATKRGGRVAAIAASGSVNYAQKRRDIDHGTAGIWAEGLTVEEHALRSFPFAGVANTASRPARLEMNTARMDSELAGQAQDGLPAHFGDVAYLLLSFFLVRDAQSSASGADGLVPAGKTPQLEKDSVDTADSSSDLFVLDSTRRPNAIGTEEETWCKAVFAASGEPAELYDKLIGMLIMFIVQKALLPCFSEIIMGLVGNRGGATIRIKFAPPATDAVKNPAARPNVREVAAVEFWGVGAGSGQRRPYPDTAQYLREMFYFGWSVSSFPSMVQRFLTALVFLDRGGLSTLERETLLAQFYPTSVELRLLIFGVLEHILFILRTRLLPSFGTGRLQYAKFLKLNTAAQYFHLPQAIGTISAKTQRNHLTFREERDRQDTNSTRSGPPFSCPSRSFASEIHLVFQHLL